MAEDKAKDAKAAEAAPKKKGKTGLIVGIVLGLLVLGGGGGFAYFKFAGGKAEAKTEGGEQGGGRGEAAAGGENGEGGGGPGSMVPLDTFVVNLAEKSGRRYLKAGISLELSSAPKDDEVKAKMPQIRDAVIVLLSSKSWEDVSSTQGKIQIRKELTHRINKILGDARVRNVFYTEFVIQ